MIEAFINYLRYEKRYSNKTAESYQIDILQFLCFIQNEFNIQELLPVKHQHIRAFVVQLVHDNSKASSIKRKISALKSFYKYNQKIGTINANPADKINTPKIPERLPKFVEQHKLIHLLDESDKYFTKENSYDNLQEKLLIDILYSTGIRRQELINLQWKDVNFDTNQIKVTGKGNKQRLIPIGMELSKSLQSFYTIQSNKYKNSTIEPYVFLIKEGKQLYPNYVYRIVKVHIGNCSTAEKKSPHVLRHSFATHMSNNGAKLNDIKELLGHTSLASTQIYTHNTIEQLKEIYKIAHPKA